MPKRTSKRLRLQTGLGLCFVVLAAVGCALPAGLLYFVSRHRFRNEFKKRLEHTLRFSALLVNAESHLALRTGFQETDVRYLEIKRTLTSISDSCVEIGAAYTMCRDAEGGISPVVCCKAQRASSMNIEQHQKHAAAFLKKRRDGLPEPVIEQRLFSNGQGKWLIGYAPFYTTGGSPAGVLGLSFSLAEFEAFERRLFWVSLASFFLILPAASAVGWIVGRRHAGALARLTSAARQVRNGDYEHRAPGSRIAELDELSVAFNDLGQAFGQSAGRFKEDLAAHVQREEQLARERDGLGELAEHRTAELTRTTKKLQDCVTQQHLSARESQAGKEKFKALLNATTDGVLLANSGGMVLACNKALADRFGRTGDDMVGTNAYSLVSAELAEQIKAHIERVFSTGEAAHFSHERDGHIFENHVYPAFDAEGKVEAVAVYSKDVTEHKQYEERLREQEKLFRLLTDNVFDGISICVYDLDTGKRKLVFCNNRYVEMSGYTKEQLLRCDNLSGLWSQHGEQKVNLSLDEESVIESVFTGTASWNRPDGKENTFEWNAVYIRMGEKHQIVEIDRDVTERVRSEDELLKRKEFIETILDNLPTGLAVSAIDSGAKQFVNAKFTEIYGWPSEDFSTIDELYERVFPNAGFRKRIIQKTRSALTTDEPAKMLLANVPIITKNGEKRMVTAVNFPLPDQKLMISTVQDVTEHVRMEEVLSTQERLAAVGQLAAGIAHDFNNALSVILGYTHILKSDATIAAPARDKLKTIYGQAKHAAQLVKQILDFSRRSISQPIALDLLSFLKEQVKLLQRTIPESIQIELHSERGRYTVHADPTQIQQVVTNLVVNAWDAMPNGGKLKISLHLLFQKPADVPPCPSLPVGQWVVLSVEDTGIGIEAEHLPHIFDPFFTTKPGGKGTGLGLPQVYGLVKQHNGFITADSVPGEGTVFKIYLPFIAVDEIEMEPESGEIFLGRAETILLVEDEEDVLEVMKSMLARLGYNVLTATDGREALVTYQENAESISLVISDVVMPNINGFELFSDLKQLDPDAKVILMSGYPLGEEGAEIIKDGAVGWLKKPITVSQLALLLRETLGPSGP